LPEPWHSATAAGMTGPDSEERPAVAPPVPPELGQTALAGKPTTLYAHVWNFGIAQAPNVVVEFYWCDPALGINATGAHFIGVTLVSLGARGSGRSHAVVKCPLRGTRRWDPRPVPGPGRAHRGRAARLTRPLPPGRLHRHPSAGATWVRMLSMTWAL
jgi:hypothetical protein